MWWNDYSNEEVAQICLDIEEKQEKHPDPYADPHYWCREHYGDIHYWCKLVDEAECVYILSVGENYYKIGRTCNIRTRLKAFRSSNPFLVNGNQIVALFTKTRATRQRSPNQAVERLWSPVFELEKSAHQWCRQRGKEVDKSYKSELFKLSVEDLRDLFSFLTLNQDVRLVSRAATEFLMDHIVNFGASMHRPRGGFDAYAGKTKTLCENRQKLLTFA